MELFYSTQLAIPLYQVGLLLFLSSLSLFIGKTKVALVINYLFVLYWGYVLNWEAVLGSGIPKLDLVSACYFGFAVLIIILAAIGFLNADAK
jgi:hypothetical protein